VAVALLGTASGPATTELKAERFVLLKDGEPAAVLKMTEEIRGKPTLAIADALGKTRAGLSVEPGWIETVFELEPTAETRAGVRLFSGRISAGLFVWDKTGWKIGKLWSADSETRLELVTPDGTQGITSQAGD
jgi:hypothetical protein